MRVLGIETSCDETGLAIYDAEHGLLANVLHSQIATHRPHGGVVPELASRDHIKHIVLLLQEVLAKANLSKHDLDAVAYTAGPGLIGALLTGASFAKSLAYALRIPALAIHHLEAHILAAQLENPNITFPLTALLVSGGHSQLIAASGLGQYQLLGDTLDDAVGEAFDKTAKLMGIPYPGGPKLAKLAESYQADVHEALRFPRPMINRADLNFSFSGLKTHALTQWQKSNQDHAAQIAIAHAFQTAVVETLASKCQRALLSTGHQTLVVAGGVGANQALRQYLKEMVQTLGKAVYFPKIEYCTDNGAMVAYAGYLHLQTQARDSDLAIQVKPRWPLAELCPSISL